MYLAKYNKIQIFVFYCNLFYLVQFVGLIDRTECNKMLGTKNITKNHISNFHRVLNAVLGLLGNLPASEPLVPTFRNLLAVPSS